jgi:hypothetical protein
MRALAHDAARGARVLVEVMESHGMALPFREASFDTVVFNLVL